MALRLTEAGRSRARAIVSGRVQAVDALLEALSTDQLAALDDIAETLLRTAATSFDEAMHICRLCDGAACPFDRCPVHPVVEAHLAGRRAQAG